ncbi:MAG: MBL fold metallo-hydrolase [Bryobacteraceae bacterium]
MVHEVVPGVWFRDAEPEKRIIANSGWVVFRDWVVVIDANFPWGARPLIEDVRRTTDKPIRFVFNTHYHSDHAFGNSVFVDAGAAIIGSEESAAESVELNPAAWKGDDLKPYRLVHPHIAFRDKLAIDDGSQRLELLRVGPAHTRGDAVAWLPKGRVLFTGDLVVNRRGSNYTGDPGADPDGWVRVLDSLAQREAAIVAPGHGAQGSVETIRGNRNYLAAIITGVREAIARGIPVEQVEQQLDLSRHQPWAGDPERNRTSIRAFYAKLKR